MGTRWLSMPNNVAGRRFSATVKIGLGESCSIVFYGMVLHGTPFSFWPSRLPPSPSHATYLDY